MPVSHESSASAARVRTTVGGVDSTMSAEELAASVVDTAIFSSAFPTAGDFAIDTDFTSRYQSIVLDPNAWSSTDYASNAAVLQAAIDAATTSGGVIVLPPGKEWKIDGYPLTLKSRVGLQVLGGHRQTFAGITTTSGDLFVLAATCGYVTIKGLYLRSRAGGGHIFNSAGFNITQWKISENWIQQDNDASSVLKTDGGDMLDAHWDDNYYQHTLTATVPTFHCISNDNSISTSTWSRSRFLYSGNYSIWIETAASGYCQDDTISDINFEVCNGGEVKLLSVRAVELRNCAGYDGGTYLRHRVYVGQSATGAASRGVVLNRVTRRNPGSLDVGIKDIRLESGGVTGTVFNGCNGSIDADSTSVVITSVDNTSPGGGAFVNLSEASTSNISGISTARSVVAAGTAGNGYLATSAVQSADPGAPTAGFRLYPKTVGSYTQLFARFPTGSAQPIVSEGGGVVTLTDAATIAVDGSARADVYDVTLGGNRTLGVPSNRVDGQVFRYRIYQDGTGGRTLAYSAFYRFNAAFPQPVMPTAAGALMILTFVCNATAITMDCIGISAGIGSGVVTLVDATSVVIDGAVRADAYDLTLGGNRTLATPSNRVDGQIFKFRIYQDGTGGRTLAYGSAYRFDAAFPQPIMPTAAGALMILTFMWNATASKMDCIGIASDRVAAETLSDLGTSSGVTRTLTLATFGNFKINVTGIVTIAMSGAPTTGTVQAFTLQVTMTGGPFAITWPAAFKWAGGVAPTYAAGDIMLVSGYTNDGGTTYRVSASAAFA